MRFSVAFWLAIACLLSVLMPLTGDTQERIEQNVVHGILSGLALTMDAYYPADPNHRGVILIPGSVWDGRESGYTDWEVKAGYDYVNELRDALVQAGFTVFVPNHRMAPEHRYPAAVDDAQRAVRFIRHNASRFAVEASPLAALGHSSGGHLASMLGVLDDDPALQSSRHSVEHESSRVQAVVAIAAPHDLSASNHFLMPFTVAFIGERPPMDAEWQDYLREGRYAEASTVTHVTPDDAAFMLIHATEDRNVSPEHMAVMGAAARAAGLSVETVSIEVNSHSPELDHAAIVSWLEAQLL